MDALQGLGLVGVAAMAVGLALTSMLALRVMAAAAGAAAVAWGLMVGNVFVAVLAAGGVGVNLVRIWQLWRDTRNRMPPERQDGFDWLVEQATRRALPDGAALFRQGEPAGSMFVLLSGTVRLPELGVTLGPGSLIGEMGLFSDDGRRTASALAAGPVEVAELRARRVKEVFFDNPTFAYRLVRLITRRLMENQSRQDRPAAVRAPTLPPGGPLT